MAFLQIKKHIICLILDMFMKIGHHNGRTLDLFDIIILIRYIEEAKVVYKNVLVSISHGSNSYLLFQKGLEIALNNKAQLTLCHIKNMQYIMPNFTNGSVYMPQDIVYFETNDGIEETLNKYKEEALKKGVSKVDVVVTASSTPALAITGVVATGFECDLIVCGSSSSKGWFFKLFGNVTSDIVKNAPVDVLVVKNVVNKDEKE